MENKNDLTKKIVITGGGSGGHVSAASSIITAIQQRYTLTTDNFMYIGGDLGMENEKKGNSIEKKVFSKETFQQKYIRAGKLQRSVSFQSISLLLRVCLGFLDTQKIFKTFKPDIIISTGGFVSVPVCIVGKLHKAEIYIHEQTASVGLSNKIVAKFAKKIFLTFPSSSKYFPEEKTIHTGNLVRPEIFKTDGNTQLTNSIKKMTELQEELPIIYISGGGLGSHSINMTVKESLKSLLQDFQVILQTGDNKQTKDFDTLMQEKNKLSSSLKDRFIPVKYINNDEIGFVLNNVDLFVGRAGANTVYELGILKIPSILIPIPWVTHNEQEENAKILQTVGLAKILNEGELTSEKLVLEINKLSKKEKTLNLEEIEKIFVKDADKKVLENINF